MTTLRTWTRRIGLLAVACGMVTLFPVPASAEEPGRTELLIDFRKPAEAAAQARWDDMDRITCGERGLGRTGKKRRGERPVTLRTVEPLGLGYAWHPPAAVNVSIAVRWSDAGTAPRGRLWVRYGCDGAHWSEWRDVPAVQAQQPAARELHETRIHIPWSDRARYAKLLSVYAMQDVTWKQDEEAAVTWILERYPSFFEHARPFVGFLQLMYETAFPAGACIEALELRADWNAPQPRYPRGMAKELAGRSTEAWRFRADYSHETGGSSPERKAETKAVYEAALRHAMQQARAPGYGMDGPFEQLVVMSRTPATPAALPQVALTRARDFRRHVGKMPPDLWAAFSQATAVSHWVPEGLQVGVPVVLLSNARFARFNVMHGQERWNAFYDRWPGCGGRFWLSGVGFHRGKDGERALVHVGRMYGVLAGYGTLMMLTKKDGTWAVAKAIRTWES